ncbi:MAG: NAD-dependent epimerase/dehydratase family protein [Anaerolineae bacterium]|nr:NAD-dependent epimerase/dehydratase family protein [Thermoflexales bacterium]MDW8406555.1 NAD-dependent epimerase/dehydratase family protein [Anaerolineae bacterium]
MNELHVVFGATGALGSAIVRCLSRHNKPVLAVVRDEDKAQRVLPEDTEYSVADALDTDHVQYLCQGATAIYNCVHTRGENWFKLTENLIAGAKAVGARLIYPSNIHVYGPLQRSPATEDHPRLATSKRGILRNSIEKMLADAHTRDGLQYVIPRLGGIYGPLVTDSFIAEITESAIQDKQAFWYGKLDVLFDLVYVDDAAMACVLLSSVPQEPGDDPVWHIPGCGPITGRRFIELTFQAAGHKPKMGVRSRLMLSALGMAVPAAKELVELLYEFETPTLMDGSKFTTAFPRFRYTPYEEGIPRMVEWFREYLAEQASLTGKP